MLNFFILLCFLNQTSLVEWLSTTQYDFGEIRQGKAQQHHFKFKNISDRPVVIDNIRTDCSCTALDWSSKPIAPQAESKVTVRYDARSTGAFRKKISVWLRGQRKAEKLTIEGTVIE